MNDWWEDYGYPAIGVTVVVGVLALIGYAFYWRYNHPCIKYQAVWKEAWTEIQTHTNTCGKDCTYTTVVPIHHPAHWAQQCMVYGNRKDGDVEAAYAPIPVGNVER
jgi:hypothetical protein